MAIKTKGQVYKCAMDKDPRHNPNTRVLNALGCLKLLYAVVVKVIRSSNMGVSTRRLRAISPVDLSNRKRAVMSKASDCKTLWE